MTFDEHHIATKPLMNITMWHDIWWMPQCDIDFKVAIWILQFEITIKECHNPRQPSMNVAMWQNCQQTS